MTPIQKTIVAGIAIVLVGAFVVSDFKWLQPKDEKAKGSGTASATGETDPNMMLEVSDKDFPNATGDCGCSGLKGLKLK
jgi:hypothetical protein